MKKIITVLLMATLLFSLASCEIENTDSSISSYESNIDSGVVLSSNLNEVSSTDNDSSKSNENSSNIASASSALNYSSQKSSSIYESETQKTESKKEVPEIVSSKLVSSNKAEISDDISLLSVSSPIGRNEMATLSIKGKPNAEYSISVYYSTTASKADGLENKTSDSSGNASWTRKIGGKTKAGTHNIVIKEVNGNATLKTSFITTE